MHERARDRRWVVAAMCAVLIAVAHETSAQTPAPVPSVEPTPKVSPPERGVVAGPRMAYVPPPRGAPAARVDGGSRGSGVSLISLVVLAPDHTGLTIREQPTLYWYQSDPADVPFELTVIQSNVATPILRVQRPHASKAGIHKLRLADHGVKLAPGIEYEWVVALVVDGESRSKDVIASGFIERVEPSARLSRRLDGVSKLERPYVYAEEGIWYDALETLSDQIDAHPDDPSLRAERAALLNQVGLTKAAVLTDAPVVVEGRVRTPPTSP